MENSARAVTTRSFLGVDHGSGRWGWAHIWILWDFVVPSCVLHGLKTYLSYFSWRVANVNSLQGLSRVVQAQDACRLCAGWWAVGWSRSISENRVELRTRPRELDDGWIHEYEIHDADMMTWYLGDIGTWIRLNVQTPDCSHLLHNMYIWSRPGRHHTEFHSPWWMELPNAPRLRFVVVNPVANIQHVSQGIWSSTVCKMEVPLSYQIIRCFSLKVT